MKPNKDPKSAVGVGGAPVGTPAPAAAEVATEQMIRVYNRSTRQTFDHGKYKASPSSFATVPQDVAERWFRLFPETIIEAGVAQKELGGISAELAAVRGELLTKTTDVANKEKSLVEAGERIADLELQLEAKTAELTSAQARIVELEAELKAKASDQV